jgi:anti-anti-sigma regulatory factor
MKEGTSMSVCVSHHTACVRITGRAVFSSSVDFDKLMAQLQTDGCNEIILDLGECPMMDSTFLGVMAKVAKGCAKARQNGHACILELFHPAERVLEMLENLDVLKLFTVISDTPPLGAFKRVEQGNTTRVELNRTCYEAHETLMNTSPENERRFRDATEFFRKNLEEDDGKK